MSMTTPYKFHGPKDYRIRLRGHLSQNWSDWFAQMAVATEGSDTILTGSVPDQAALHGLLNRIRDLNLTLLSVERIYNFQEDGQ
jgi:hypothetical protein